MPPISLTDTAKVHGGPELSNAALLDFWRWGYSDLSDDDVKGAFAEWIVQKLLGIAATRRILWANSDLITSSGVRIEVKSSAYWQSWKYLDESGQPLAKALHEPTSSRGKIRFTGLMAGDSTQTDRSKKMDFKSDLYVFAFQNETNLDRWNALDLSQWEFYLVTRQKLVDRGWKSISLQTLYNEFGALSAERLSVLGREAIANVEAESEAKQTG